MTLNEFNLLSPKQAQSELLKCCGSARWAAEVTAARPFENVDRLSAKADRIWSSLSTEDWLEAFRAHPQIGEKKAATQQSEQTQTWSAQEQYRLENAPINTRAALAEGNLRYKQRFGFIFIICATGKTAEEMLENLKLRLQNDRETELRAAAEEQRKITRLRLEKLLTR